MPSFGYACTIDEQKYSGLIELHDEGNGNYIVIFPQEIETHNFSSINLDVTDKTKTSKISGKLDASKWKGKFTSHINIQNSSQLEASVTIWWKNEETKCPIITVKNIKLMK